MINIFFRNLYILFILFISCSTNPQGCGAGFSDINGVCYNNNDMEVLQTFIESSSTTISMTLDLDSSGKVEPLELTTLKWNDSGRLTYLWLYSINLSGEIPYNIGSLTFLDTLNLSHNLLTGDIPESIGNLKRLNYLYLYSNQLSGTVSDTICSITSNLSNLLIGYNNL